MKYGGGEGESHHMGTHCPFLQHYSKAERSRNTVSIQPEVMNMGVALDTGQEQKCHSFAWEECFLNKLHKSAALEGL